MDWTNPVGSAVSGAFGVLGSGLNYVFNKRLAEQQNAYNLQMWNLNNEYNKPINQMRRYEEAGLNPALMYGSVTPGTSSAPAHQVTPEAPDFSGPMRDLAQAFNIEGLKTAIANRKKAQADASNAATDAERNSLELSAEKNVGLKYTYDANTGMLVPRPLDTDGYVIVHPSAYYFNRILAENYRTNSLLKSREGLIGTQSQLNRRRTNLLAPQIRMANYEARYYPYNYWIGNVRQGVQAVSALVPKLTFTRPPLRFKR